MYETQKLMNDIKEGSFHDYDFQILKPLIFFNAVFSFI